MLVLVLSWKLLSTRRPCLCRGGRGAQLDDWGVDIVQRYTILAMFLFAADLKSGMTVIHAEDLNTMSLEKIVRRAKEVVGDTPTYITFDIDCLDPAFAPGTGTPEVGGLTTNQALTILRGLTDLNLIGGDVVEIAPDYDATTNTAHAGAQILFEILSLISLSQEQRSRA